MYRKFISTINLLKKNKSTRPRMSSQKPYGENLFSLSIKLILSLLLDPLHPTSHTSLTDLTLLPLLTIFEITLVA